MNLFDIECLINRKYKDGDDWVYAKSKKAEIELIKDLLEICESQREEILDLARQVDVLDEWKVYRKAECQLERTQRYFKDLHHGLIEYKEVMEQLDKAKEKIAESEAYMVEILEKLEEKNA
jgi:predicted translin family RNA/ssDNA-binding protein